MTREELFQFEKWLELAFEGLLTGATTHIFKSREADPLQSPRIEIKAVLGKALEHRKGYTDGKTNDFDAYEATLEITVATNRATEEGAPNHNQLLGTVRSRVSMKYALANWASDVTVILDIRPQGTIDTFSDENCIDLTALSFYLVFNVKPSAWPEL